MGKILSDVIYAFISASAFFLFFYLISRLSLTIHVAKSQSLLEDIRDFLDSLQNPISYLFEIHNEIPYAIPFILRINDNQALHHFEQAKRPIKVFQVLRFVIASLPIFMIFGLVERIITRRDPEFTLQYALFVSFMCVNLFLSWRFGHSLMKKKKKGKPRNVSTS